ncbi:ATP-binding protein [Candidatus Bathyarchaeota archaeon]|nr:ATP-binding protein [Candidatus Bathyarchaeota archaeon]
MSIDLETAGKSIGTIPVHFSYNIIELFSGHLYSSPIKAIEELVANSYDAFASQCVVSVPEKIEDQSVWVWDNGDSMNLEELKDLWLVADTRKRIPKEEKKSEKRGRLPIGKFGIGKLASYVLGRRITHICKKNGEYLAVTMDYKQIKKRARDQEIKLSVRKLSETEVISTVPSVHKSLLEDYGIDISLDAFDHWTLVVVDTLKKQLDNSRLNWILSTALPLRPDFKLFLNGREIISSKSKVPKIREWQIGKDDTVAKKLSYKTGEDKEKEEPFNYYVKIPNHDKISGIIEVYKDAIDTGKSTQMGYSNGFFIMVRQRLINENDNLFGITNLPHLGFNRIRAVIYADFLDDFLVANREDTSNAEAKDALQTYIRALYYEARSSIEKKFEEEAKEETLEDHLKNLPGTLLSYPLRQAVERINSEQYSGFSIRTEPGKKAVATIETVELRETDVEGPLATLDEGKLYINVNHPFYRDYADYPGVRKLMVAEILLEAYMIDAGVNEEQTREILSRRDQLLRTLASKLPEDAIEVSDAIRVSVTSQNDLEIACVDGFTILGYEAAHLGGKGRPDGLVVAPLGIQKGGPRG